jgi:hypothetical protein
MIYASDSAGHYATTTISLYVIQPISIALTAPSPSTVVSPGTTVSFNAQAYGFTNPSYAVVDSLSGSSITNTNINSAGNFNWTPTSNDIGVHTLTVSAVDIYSHFSNAATTITVSNTGTQTTTTTTTTTATASGTQSDGYVFSNFLHVGSKGKDVTELQKRLTSLNVYSGPITGYFGSLTKAAVAAFQGQHNISAVGYVGPATRAALNGN